MIDQENADSKIRHLMYKKVTINFQNSLITRYCTDYKFIIWQSGENISNNSVDMVSI